MFESPAEQFWRYRIRVTNPVTTDQTTVVVEANPARIGLIISLSSTRMVMVSTDPSLSVGSGIKVKFGAPLPLQITHRDFGALVGSAWYGRSSDVSSIHVIEVIIDKYPIGG